MVASRIASNSKSHCFYLYNKWKYISNVLYKKNKVIHLMQDPQFRGKYEYLEKNVFSYTYFTIFFNNWKMCTYNNTVISMDLF